MSKRRRIGQSWGLGRLFMLVGFTVIFTGLALWQVRRKYDVIAAGYAIDRDLFEYRRSLEIQKRLGLLLAAYKDPSSLRVFAEEELGMQLPGRERELVVPSGPQPSDAQGMPTRGAP